MSELKKKPLMPQATAVWLLDNTALTFKQIADFCCMHELEVKGIADNDVAPGVVGIDPVALGQLTKQEILRCTSDSGTQLQINENPADSISKTKLKKSKKYTPLARRQDKPDAICWFLKNHPKVLNKHIVKLLGTTSKMIESIRDRSHWNINNIRPRDPVLLGICSQMELDRLLAEVNLD